MRKLYLSKPLLTNVLAVALLAVAVTLTASGVAAQADQMVDQTQLGVQIPTLGNILTFIIRGFFVVTGLAAFMYLMFGAFGWVASGGKEEKISEARGRIQAALVGVVLVFAMLAVITTLEQVVFAKRLCFGLTCPVSIPGLAKACVAGYADANAWKNGAATICCPKGKTQKATASRQASPLLTPAPTLVTQNIDVCDNR